MPPITVLAILYVLFCILVGLTGSQRRMGFTGTFLLSFLFTPVVMLLVLLLTGPSKQVEQQRRSQSD